MLGKGYLCAVVTQDAWQTPTTNMDMVRSEEGVQKRIAFRASIGRKSIPDGNLGEQMQRLHGQAAPANPSTDGSRQGLWATPQASDHIEGARTELTSNQKCLGRDMKQWATPIMGDSHLASTPEVAQKRIEEGKVTLSRQNPGKLNPRWVETLMGLPVGWTMPSCASPRTIAPTNSDSWATESSQPQPRERFEF
jgi:hypothetical protein